MREWLTVVVLVAAATCLAPAGCQAGETKIVLREYLNEQWTKELLTYPFAAPRGACSAASVTLTGPQGQPVPVQLSEVAYWPGTQWVKTARLSFVADLAPLATDTYTVRYGERGTASTPPAADLQVLRGRNQVKITTGQFGVRLLLGERTYAEPVAATEVPGPVMALRLGDGTWFGESDLYGEAKIRGYSAQLVAAGPVFGEVSTCYTYADGNTLQLTMRVHAGADDVEFDTAVAKLGGKEGVRLLLSRGLPPLTLRAQATFYPTKEAAKKVPRGDWFSLPLADCPDGFLIAVKPWAPWWCGDVGAPVVRIAMGEGTRELHISRRDPVSWVTAGNPDGWEKSLPVMKSPEGDVYVELALGEVGRFGGQCKFALADRAPTEAVGWRYRRDEVGTPGRRTGAQVIPYHEPLNVVKDYILEWPQKTKHPHVFVSQEDLKQTQAAGVTSERLRAAWEVLRPATVKPEQWMVPDGWKSLPTGNLSPSKLPEMSPADRQRWYNWIGSMDETGRYLVSGAPELANPLALGTWLSLLGDFDEMRSTMRLVGLYDALIDSPQVTPSQRRLYRAQMAYYAYYLNNPAIWSNERGWNSGNQNMTLAYNMLNRGSVACLLADHPMAKQWVAPAVASLQEMLGHIGSNGEWPESAWYANLSISHLVGFSIVATNAGFGDYVNDPRLKKAVRWAARCWNPPDPRTGGLRSGAMFGRGGGGAPAMYGAMARATAKSDPEYSQSLMWAWQQMPGRIAIMPDETLGGYEFVYLDPTLPAKAPNWGSESFPDMGVILEHGLDTPNWHRAMVLSGDAMGMIYGSQTGAVMSLFGYGQPLGGCFGGHYDYQEEFLQCKVSLARSPGTPEHPRSPVMYFGAPLSGWWFEDRPKAIFGQQTGDGNVSAFAALPRQDYAAIDVAFQEPTGSNKDLQDLPWPPLLAGEGKPPLTWRRQVLYLRDDDPAGANYLVLRDSVRGNQPTMWTFWTQSDKLGTTAEAANAAAFLADKPGPAIVPARQLTGDRFTALGRRGVDLDYFVAEPRDTPRYTLRWGVKYTRAPIYEPVEYQDLLHLQLPGDGAYFVALYPRKRDWSAPTFSTLGDGLIIKVAGDFGTDYGFLSALEATASGEGASFRGTAASVQDRKGGLVLSLGAAGEVRYQDYGLAADFAASLRGGEKEVTVEFPENVIAGDKTMEPMIPFPGGTVTVTAPGEWALVKPLPGVKLTRGAAGWVLTVPAGVRTVRLTDKGGV